MNRPLTRKEWLAYLDKAIKEFDWEAAYNDEQQAEPVAFINVEERKLEWAKYMIWDTPTVVNLPKIPLYTSQPHRQWVGLTDEEVFDVWLNEMPAPDKVFYQKLCRSVEAKLKEKNT